MPQALRTLGQVKASYHRVNKSVILVVFESLTRAGVDSIMSAVQTEYELNQTEASLPNFHNITVTNLFASSVADGAGQDAEGYYVVQIDKIGTPLPWGITDFISRKVNELVWGEEEEEQET